MAHVAETRSNTARTVAGHVLSEIRRDVVAAVVTGPLVVPIWWGIWKLCDTLWTMK